MNHHRIPKAPYWLPVTEHALVTSFLGSFGRGLQHPKQGNTLANLDKIPLIVGVTSPDELLFLRPKPVSVAINLNQDGSPASVTAPESRSNVALAVKTGMDFAIALLGILFVSPLLVITAALIKLDSRGPVLFRQRRTGLNGRVITVLKFRTMHVLEDGETIRHASRKDHRVTRVGRFLRRTSIDELPQLFNVLNGSMSIVGPRPHALAHDAHYSAALPTYAQRFRMKPGITGLAQVSGMRGEIKSVESMADRVDADNRYIDTWSLRADVKIMVKTAVVVAFQDAAY